MFPILGALIFQVMYSAADMLILGRFGTAAPSDFRFSRYNFEKVTILARQNSSAKNIIKVKKLHPYTYF